MAVGDVVSAISSDDTILDFQPAAGVECVITTVFNYDLAIVAGLYNGSVLAASSMGTTDQAFRPCKIFINNTNYLRINATTGTNRSAYTGIQIK